MTGRDSETVRFGLAPMAGYGDLSFRRICRQFGAGYTVTEMVSAKALCYGDKKTLQLLRVDRDAHPAAVQLFGHEPDILAEGARRAYALCSPDAVDINMGCPALKIVRAGDGAALARDIPLAARCVAAVVSAVPCPVTVKCRAGWDAAHRNAEALIAAAAAAGASAVCLHGRTRDQLYTGKADRCYMREVVQSAPIPVWVNGDVTDAETGLRLLAETGAPGALVGRGALGAPWIFAELAAAVRGVPYTAPAHTERMEWVRIHAALAAGEKGEHTACREMRAHLAFYIRGIRGAASLRKRASAVRTLDDIRMLTAEAAAHAEEDSAAHSGDQPMLRA